MNVDDVKKGVTDDVILERYVSGYTQELEKNFFDGKADAIYDRIWERTILSIKADVLADNFKHYKKKVAQELG